MVTNKPSGSDRAIVFAIFCKLVVCSVFRFIPRSMGLFCRFSHNDDMYVYVIHYTVSARMPFRQTTTSNKYAEYPSCYVRFSALNLSNDSRIPSYSLYIYPERPSYM